MEAPVNPVEVSVDDFMQMVKAEAEKRSQNLERELPPPGPGINRAARRRFRAEMRKRK